MKNTITTIIAFLLIALLAFTSSCQYGIVDTLGYRTNGVAVNQGGDIKVIRKPITKDTLRSGQDVKFFWRFIKKI